MTELKKSLLKHCDIAEESTCQADLKKSVSAHTSEVLARKQNWQKRACKISFMLQALIIFLLLVIILGLASFSLCTKSAPSPSTQKKPFDFAHIDPSSTLYKFSHAAVASDTPICSDVGNYMMEIHKGNAIDAAIATAFCHKVVIPFSCGLTSSVFFNFYNRSEKRSYVFDMRTAAPLASTRDMFDGKRYDQSLRGGKSIGVFGAVTGFAQIHRKFGKLPWKLLIQPSIELARKGFKIDEHFFNSIEKVKHHLNDPQFSELKKFLTNKDSGKYLEIGDTLRDEKMARTLKLISDDPFSMKNGSLAKSMLVELKKGKSIIGPRDLAEYKMMERQPFLIKSSTDDNQMFHAVPPPSSASLVAFIVNIMKNFHWPNNTLTNSSYSALFAHRFIESMKFAYALRAHLGDPNYVNVTKITDLIKSPAHARKMAKLITDDRTHPISYYFPDKSVISRNQHDHGTSNLNVISSEGDAVALTTSINYIFGSLVRGENTGIIYNDDMNDFSVPDHPNVYNITPSWQNFIAPKKRPMSSMSPSIVTDCNGDVVLNAGGTGGVYIISSTAQAAVLNIILHQSPQTAIDFYRMHNHLIPNVVLVEHGFPRIIIDMLKSKGHKIQVHRPISRVEMISIRNQTNAKRILANADHRKNGKCSGF